MHQETIPSLVQTMMPVQRQAIIWTNAGILLIGLLGTKFSEILIKIHTFSFKKLHLEMSSAKMAVIFSQPQCVNTISLRMSHPAITMISYKHHSIWNHSPLHCLFNSLFRLTTKKTSKVCNTGPLWGIHFSLLDSYHKELPLQKKCFHITTS